MMKTDLEKILIQCETELKKVDRAVHPRTKRYSNLFKKNVCSFVRLGGKKTIVLNRLGIASSTIYKWLKMVPSNKKLFKKIKVLSNNSNVHKKFTLSTPSGYTVQFEHPQDLVSVLKLLA